jgi:large subunit GTPase 1
MNSYTMQNFQIGSFSQVDHSQLIQNRDFTAQKEQVTILDTDGLPKTFKVIDGTNSLEEQKPLDANELQELQQKFGIPRRPKWSRTMTKQELHKLENEAFLEWRRNLAK